MEFLSSFLRRHFAGKPVVELRNVGCFLKIIFSLFGYHLHVWQFQHLTQLFSEILLVKGVHDWIHCRVGNQHQKNDLLDGAFKGTGFGQKANASVVSSKVGDVEGRDDQEDHGGCPPLTYTASTWMLRDFAFVIHLIEADLGDHFSCFSGERVRKVKEMACYTHESYQRGNLENDDTRDLHEHGIPWVVVIRENGRKWEKQKWHGPGSSDETKDSFLCHDCHVPQRSCNGDIAIHGHGEKIRVGAVHECETDFEECASVRCVEGEAQKIAAKYRWKERQSYAHISYSDGEYKPVSKSSLQASGCHDKVNNDAVANQRQSNEEPTRNPEPHDWGRGLKLRRNNRHGVFVDLREGVETKWGEVLALFLAVCPYFAKQNLAFTFDFVFQYFQGWGWALKKKWFVGSQEKNTYNICLAWKSRFLFRTPRRENLLIAIFHLSTIYGKILEIIFLTLRQKYELNENNTEFQIQIKNKRSQVLR